MQLFNNNVTPLHALLGWSIFLSFRPILWHILLFIQQL